MENFINFLKEYKDVLVSGLCVILTLVAMLIKRRPKTIDEFFDIVANVCNRIPEFVEDFEEPGHGPEKKDGVVCLAIKFCEKELGRSLSSTELDYCKNAFGNMVEKVLSAPQKKGVNHESW